jgi:hypothetical protein
VSSKIYKKIKRKDELYYPFYPSGMGGPSAFRILFLSLPL